MGLTLNRSKCEVITRNNISISHDALRDFKQIEVKDAQLLGAPLSSETALQQCLKARTKELEENLCKLALIARPDALLILRSSLGSPKMIHTLRCQPSNKHPELETYYTNLRHGLEQILSVSLNDLQWTQASLLIKMGGLDIRRAFFACTTCLFGFSCQHSSSPDPHSHLYQSHTGHAFSRHDLRVVLQVGLQ